jgi:hypothetical protein
MSEIDEDVYEGRKGEKQKRVVFVSTNTTPLSYDTRTMLGSTTGRECVL